MNRNEHLERQPLDPTTDFADRHVARSGRSGRIARGSARLRALRMLEAQRRQGAKFGAKYGMPVRWIEPYHRLLRVTLAPSHLCA